ncbi:MAG: hypothetical protein GY861_03025 [bacterium]|nr:hypothetical protein [bacterium]
MKRDKIKTKVIFRKFKEGDVIALFPEIAGNMCKWTCQSYMHIGQHGAASLDIIASTKPATPTEYHDLATELILHCGYNLQVIKRNRYSFMEARLQQIRG